MNYQNHQIREKILIVDYGSQVTKLIARRVRELGAFSEIINPLRLERIKDIKIYKGIILSGGPSTVVNSPQKNIVLNKNYNKTILNISEDEIKLHKSFLKKELKKNFY